MKTPFVQWQTAIDEMFRERGWQYWTPLSIGGRLIEESGELAREVNHHFGDKKKRVDEEKGSILLEVGDIAYTLICLANSLGYVIGASSVRTNGYYNDRFDPMSMLNRLGGHIGKLLHSIDEQHTRGTMRARIAAAMLSLQEAAHSMGISLDEAIEKGIEKVRVRDKDRFPEGR